MIGDLLKERIDTILERWEEAVLSSYPPDAAALFLKQQDPFANPIGATVRKGTRGVLESILGDLDSTALRSHLDEVIRVRAVQEMDPSQALSFLFSLKTIFRDLLPEADADPRLRRELTNLEGRVDEVVLAAFDVYAECREEVGRLRVNEVKRQVAWVFEKMNQREPGGPEFAGPPDDPPFGNENA